MFVFQKYSVRSRYVTLLTRFVAVMTPASDLCFTCQQNIMKAMQSIRKQQYENAFQHLETARAGRHYYYRTQCERAEAAVWIIHTILPSRYISL